MIFNDKRCFGFILIILVIFTSIPANIHIGDPAYKTDATVDYLIIAPADSGMIFQAQRLAELKKDRGLRTRIEVTDSISAFWPGIDMPAKIRACVQSYYADSGLTWLLLFGDFKRVPARKVSLKDSLSADWSDIYYACLEGSWDTDSNGIYGEEASQISYIIKYGIDSAGYLVPVGTQEKVTGLDVWPDVYVGRLPVASAAEAEILVNKLISYSNDWRHTAAAKNVSLFGPQMFSTTRLSSGLMIDDVSKYLHYDIKPEFSDGASEFSGGFIRELYEDKISAGDTVINDSIEITVDSLSAFLSQGDNLVLFCAHGSPQGIRICSFADKPAFTSTDVLALTSATYSNIIGQSCQVMSMPPESAMCFAKAFLLNPAGGAVSFYGNSNIDYPAATWSLIRQALSYLCDGTVSRLAPAFQVTNIDKVRFNQYTHQFWGDPEMEVWTKSLSMSDSIALSIGRDGNFFFVATQPPIDSILVSIREPEGRLLRSYTQSGVAVFDTMVPAHDSLRVSSTRHNYLPGRLSIKASSIPVNTKYRFAEKTGLETGKIISIINRNQAVIRAGGRMTVLIFSIDGRVCYTSTDNHHQKSISLRPGLYVAQILLPSCRKMEKFAVSR